MGWLHDIHTTHINTIQNVHFSGHDEVITYPKEVPREYVILNAN